MIIEKYNPQKTNYCTVLEIEICLMFVILLLSSASKTKITFYGGVHEIGGNKFDLLDIDVEGSEICHYYFPFLKLFYSYPFYVH
jgi:hypothetical protein